MSSPTTTIFSFLLLLSVSLSYATPTVYEVLESYGFPAGILPKGATGYEINEETGEFKVFLDQTCKFSIEGYDLEYKSTISGVVSQNRITHLKGVSVRIFILWLTIGEVRKTNNDLEFIVGIASASFPLDGFLESPTCGCGFDCDDEKYVVGVSNLMSS
ncbi:unnamed protein product [Amaranthus hypochondriacus]